ncbi:unnamed protein product [Auanema sp. JU1783]|nr:unnamed protein product [Auanema sp. JU1783]
MFRSLVLFVFLCLGCNAHKIFVYSPLMGHSHVNFMGRIADTLTDAGHNVTYVVPVMDLKLKKTCVKTTKDVRILPASKEVEEIMSAGHDHQIKTLWAMKHDPLSLMKVFGNMTKAFALTCKQVLNDKKFLDDIASEKFDILIAEPFFLCPFALAEKLKIPVTIGALSTIQSEVISDIIGEPVLPSFVPGSMSVAQSDMSFYERFKNTLSVTAMRYLFLDSYKVESDVIKEAFGSNFKSYTEYLADVSYVFTNAHPYLSYPRPLNRKTLELGGIVVDQSLKDKSNLKEFDAILNERKHTVLVSFGSVAKSKDMPEDHKKTLLSVFEEMKDVTFIWKYEEDTTMADHLPNVHLAKWMPQVALLNDPRLSLFVTHGGLGSTTEVAYLGKPAVFIPLFADQPSNAIMASRYGGAIVLEKTLLDNKEKIKEAFNEVLSNKKYEENAKKLSIILNNSPTNPKDILVRHIEFAGRVGRIPNLDCEGRNLNLFQFFSLDIYLAVIVIILSIISLIYIIIRKIVKYCTNKLKVKSE